MRHDVSKQKKQSQHEQHRVQTAEATSPLSLYHFEKKNHCVLNDFAQVSPTQLLMGHLLKKMKTITKELDSSKDDKTYYMGMPRTASGNTHMLLCRHTLTRDTKERDRGAARNGTVNIVVSYVYR